MSERKSSRSRKAISSYATLGDDSDDDDFAAGPSTKKMKQLPVPEKKKETISHKSDSKPTSRTSNSIHKRESLFDIDLQKVLEMSRLETGGSQDSSPEAKQQRPHSHTTNVTVDIELPPPPPPLLVPRLKKVEALQPLSDSLLSESDMSPNPPKLMPMFAVAPSVHSAVMDDSIVEMAGSGGEDKKQLQNSRDLPQRRNPVKKAIIEDSGSEDGSDFAPDADSGSDDDDNDNIDEEDEDFSSPSDNDSDFDVGKKKPKVKPAAAAKTTTTKTKTEESKKKLPSNKHNPQKSPIQVLTERTDVHSSSSNVSTKISNTRKAPSLKSSTSSSGSPPPLTSAAAKKSASSSSSSLPLQTPVIQTASTKSTHHNLSSPVSSRVVNNKVSTPHSLASKWKPPGQTSGNNSNSTSPSSLSFNSPSSGLRLGLSRNQRVRKPLHGSVNVL